MKGYYMNEVKKDRLALEMALVGFESAIEDAQAAVIRPDTLEEKMRAVGELKLAIEVLEDLYRLIEFSQQNLASYVAKTAPVPTEEESADAARAESVDSLIREEAQA